MKKLIMFVLTMVFIITFSLTTHAQEELWKKLDRKAKSLNIKNNHAEATKVAQEALKVAEDTFSPKYKYSLLAQAYIRLAGIYKAQFKFADSESPYKSAIAIYEKTRPFTTRMVIL